MPKRKIEQPITFTDLLERAQEWEGGFKVHTPDSTYISFLDELLDEHFPDRDKTEYLGPEITDEDIFRDLLAGEYVTPVDEVVVLEHFNARTPGDPVKVPAEATSFISIKSAFIGLPEGERDYTIIPVPEAEETPS